MDICKRTAFLGEKGFAKLPRAETQAFAGLASKITPFTFSQTKVREFRSQTKVRENPAPTQVGRRLTLAKHLNVFLKRHHEIADG